MSVQILGYEVPNWVLVAVPLATVYYTYLTWNYGIFKKLGIPGPRPIPILGTMLPLIKDGLATAELPMLKKYGKVFGTFMGRQPTLVIADPEMLKEIMIKRFHQFTNRFDLGANNEYITRAMLTLAKDQQWKSIRNLVTPSFSTRKLRVMTVHIERCCQTLIRNLMVKAEKGETVEFREYTGAFTVDVIASAGFGIQIDSQNDPNNEFVKYVNKAFGFSLVSLSSICIFFFPGLFKILNRMGLMHFFELDCRDFFERAVKKVVEDRTRSPEKQVEPDFIQMMMNAHLEDTDDSANDGTMGGRKQETKGLTSEELIAQAILFILAGYETTANTLGFAGYCLATHPEYQETLIEEIDAILDAEGELSYDVLKKMTYLDMFLSETLRMYPAVPRMDRVASENVEINGTFIPKGMIIGAPFYLLHHDPEAWPEPDQFRPERFTAEEKAKRHPNQWMPFGAGPRHCLGMRLALVETKMTIVHLLQNFRFKTCDKTPIPVVLDKTRMIAVGGMHLRLEKREDRNQ